MFPGGSMIAICPLLRSDDFDGESMGFFMPADGTFGVRKLIYNVTVVVRTRTRAIDGDATGLQVL